MNQLRVAVLLAMVSVLGVGQVASAAGFMQPQDFVTKASASGAAEVELGKLALQKSQSADIRTFAEKMVTDHESTNAALQVLAQVRGLQLAQPDAKQQAVLTALRAKSGAQFDAAYAEQMVTDHDQAVALFSAAGTLADEQLAAFARRILPMLVQHQEIARHLRDSH